MRSLQRAAFSSMKSNSSFWNAGGPKEEDPVPADPRLGITNECMTARSVPPAMALMIPTVSAASAIRSGFWMSGADGTDDSTVMLVEESR